MPARIELARRAEQDLLDIERWLTAEASPAIAQRILYAIRDKIDTLEEHPELAQEREELGPGRRVLVCRPYVIIYRIYATQTGEAVVILRIAHGARDAIALLEES